MSSAGVLDGCLLGKEYTWDYCSSGFSFKVLLFYTFYC